MIGATAGGASGSSFYAGMRVLPRVEREAMFAVYDFCRIVDDIADDQQGDRAIRAVQLDRWRQDLDALYSGCDAGQAGFLIPAIRGFDLEQRDFEAVIDGMAMDVARDICWPAEAELDLYCDRVASAVGRLSVRIFGMEPEPGLVLAHHLGRALQLTNILRDIDEDAAIGRVYIPAEALSAAGIVPSSIRQVVADPRMDLAGRWLAERAEGHYEAAGKLLASRPRGLLLAPRLMECAYARLLRQMSRAGWAPPRKRVRTNKVRLLLTVARLMVAG